MECLSPFPHCGNGVSLINRANLWKYGEIYFPSVLIYLKILLALSVWFATFKSL